MDAHDISAAIAALPQLDIGSATTEAEAGAAMQMLTPFDRCMVGLARFSGTTPWECHPHDELLHVLEGEVEVTVLGDGEPARRTLRAGSLCVVPRGAWHRQDARPSVTLLFVTSAEGTRHSHAEDPTAS